jgi:ABC-type transport system substrate-binding protein
LAEAGIRVKMNVMEAGAYQTALMNRTLRGLILQISYYDVERNPAADIEDGFRTNNLNAYFSNPDVEAALDKAQAATSDEEVAKWGAELNKMIYDQQLKTQLWGTSTAAGYRADKILKWESQNGSVPLTRWEYMQVKV